MTVNIINDNPLLSVIIPVYNLERYLNRCVDSVLEQEFTKIEVILVDDGSPDNCPAICDEYASSDVRIKVIHKDNGGISDARNAGMAIARGEYIMFMDGDDYWDGKTCLNKLTDTILLNYADVTLYGTKNLDYRTGREQIIRTGYDLDALRSNREDAVSSLFRTRQFPRTAWVLAVKKKFITDNSLYFVKGIKSEDVDWLINVFLHAKTFDAVNEVIYVYVINRPEAATTFVDIKNIKDIFYSLKKWMPVLMAEKNTVNRYLLSYLAIQYIIALLGFSQLQWQDKRTLMPEMKKYRGVLKYADNPKSRLSKAIVDFLGIRAGARVLLSFYRVMN